MKEYILTQDQVQSFKKPKDAEMILLLATQLINKKGNPVYVEAKNTVAGASHIKEVVMVTEKLTPLNPSNWDSYKFSCDSDIRIKIIVGKAIDIYYRLEGSRHRN